MCGRYLFDPDWDEPDDDMEEDEGAGGAGVIIREIVRKYANDPAFAGAVRKPAGDPATALAGEIFPGAAVPALVGDFSSRNAELIYWGFPFPGKPFARQIINARSETLLEKQMFARLTRNSRCLVPANAFYEWSAAEADRGGDVSGLTGKVGTVRGLTGKRGVGGAKRKTKYQIRPLAAAAGVGGNVVVGGSVDTSAVSGAVAAGSRKSARAVFYMAGLYDSFAPVNAAMLACARLQKSGADVRTKCLTILTTAATRQMSAVHDRMPVMLTPEAARLWLSGVSVDELYRSGFFAAPQDGLEIVAV